MKGNARDWIHLFFFTGVVALSTGCTSLYVEVPLERMESPVVGESSSHMLEGQWHQSEIIYVIHDAQARPPRFQPLSYRDEASFRTQVGYAYALVWPVELKANLSLSMSPSFSAKWQFWGPRGKVAKGEWVASTFGRLSFFGMSREGDQQVSFGPGGYPWKAKVSSTGAGLGASLGLGLADLTLLYGGASFDNYDADARVEQSPSTTGDSAGGQYSQRSNGQTQTISLGIQWGYEWIVDGQVGYTLIRWTSLPREPRFHASVGLQHRF